MKRGDKSGQFYIIAAIIIIALLVGVYALRNYIVTKKERTKVYNLGEELKIETGSVYDYGIYQGNNTDDLINLWAGDYSGYAKGQAVEDWILVYGNEKGMKGIAFTTKQAGTIGTIGTSMQMAVQIKVSSIESIEPNDIIGGSSGNIAGVNITFQNFTHTFNLESGQNFFCVISSGEYTAVEGG